MNPTFPLCVLSILFFSLSASPAIGLPASSPQQTRSDWVIVNEFGGGKCYVDRVSIQKRGFHISAWVKYELNPPGTDKLNKKQVKEMLMLEEYDLNANTFRVHRILFNYVDGTTGEPVLPKGEWKPATGGNEKTLNFLRTLR
jgi:hypothetical protein